MKRILSNNADPIYEQKKLRRNSNTSKKVVTMLPTFRSVEAHLDIRFQAFLKHLLIKSPILPHTFK